MRDFSISHLEEVLVDTQSGDFPLADSVEQNVLVYDASTLSNHPENGQSELYAALSDGPGIVVIKGLIADHAVLDCASEIFSTIIEHEKASGSARGDHFAKPGANDRIWNSFEKHCLANPKNFAAYYANPVLDLICRAWLGPAFQMTAQVNRVNPGGAAQTAHRDYHLGFMTEAQMRQYPASVHQLSPMLTLQGAIAHVDMPLEAGPTLYLPHSQKWPEGYLYSTRPEVQDLFGQRHAQLPLAKGDSAFFNPAVLHGSGTNKSANIFRLGNLLQVSSAMGRPMETVDRSAMIAALNGELVASELTSEQRRLLIGMVADGYPFPTTLDPDPPVGGLAPASPAHKIMLDYGL